MPDEPAQVDPALTIHQRMIGILGDLPAIGKNQRNKDQNYAFRGIDDVVAALSPLLAKWGVYYVPNVLERIEGLRQTARGNSMYVVNLHIEFTFYGWNGDAVTCSAWGEGSDTSDKSTNKATTGAQKYALVLAFSITTKDNADGDEETPENSRPVPTLAQQKEARRKEWGDRPLPEGWSSYDDFDTSHETFKLGMKTLTSENTDKVKAFLGEHSIGWPMTREQYDEAVTYVATLFPGGFAATDEEQPAPATA